MSGTLSRIAKLKALPAVAILASCLLLAGQVFNCCRFNESFAADVSRVLQSWGVMDVGHDGALTENAASHLGCHSLSSLEAPFDDNLQALSAAGSASSAGPGHASGENRLAEEQSCISEYAFAAKAQLPASLLAIEFPENAPAFFPYASQASPASIERPRPQSRSGPPIYLLTLRLLV